MPSETYTEGRRGTCITCGAELVAPGKRGKVPIYCAGCRKARDLATNRRWKARNAAHVKAYRDGYYADPENRAVSQAKSKRWHAANRERAAEYRRKQYVERQRETNTARMASYFKANPGKQAEIQNRRRARKLDQFVAPVDPAAIRTRDGGMCGICGLTVAIEDQSLDHVVPIARGGTHEPANVQLAHRVCNSRKGAKLTSELPADLSAAA